MRLTLIILGDFQVAIDIILILVVIIFLIAYLISPKPALPIKHLLPDEDCFYIKPVGWKGTPIDSKGRFMNYEHPFYQSYPQIIWWFPSNLLNLFNNFFEEFEYFKQDDNSFLEKTDTIIWLGHASFFFNINGIKILIDPQFYNASFYGRHTKPPIDPTFFTDIDYILISHDHDDHCDKKSLSLLFKQNPNTVVLTGLNMDKLLNTFCTITPKILTADWYRMYPINPPLEIYFTPSRHYCKRFGKKFNGYLWGGFIIKYRSQVSGENKCIYFEGDSGQCGHFEEIKNLFSPNLALIGIGAYNPYWFMHPNHMSPKMAIKAFDACGASTMIPMHYGTFNLSNENMDEPLKVLEIIQENRNIIPLMPGKIYPLIDLERK